MAVVWKGNLSVGKVEIITGRDDWERGQEGRSRGQTSADLIPLMGFL